MGRRHTESTEAGRRVRASSLNQCATDRRGTPTGRPLRTADHPLLAATHARMAAGRPLTAATHPLRAAGHPLLAAGLPLRAAGHPLPAAAHPLRAADEPLGAENAPLRSASGLLPDVSVSRRREGFRRRDEWHFSSAFIRVHLWFQVVSVLVGAARFVLYRTLWRAYHMGRAEQPSGSRSRRGCFT